jgi:hypothetical protein
VGEEDDEFVSTESAQQVASDDPGADDAARGTDDGVSRVVADVVVGGPESVETFSQRRSPQPLSTPSTM